MYLHTHTHTHTLDIRKILISQESRKTHVLISVRNIRNIQIHTFQVPTKPSLAYIHTFTDGIQATVFCLVIKGRNRCRIKKHSIIIEINLLS